MLAPTAFIVGQVIAPLTKERFPSSNVWGAMFPTHIEKSVVEKILLAEALRIIVNAVS